MKTALIATCLAVIILTCSCPGWGQTTLQDQLNADLKGKVLLLRNFYSGSDLRYDQNGTLLTGGTPGSWTLANVEITGFTVTSNEIEIAGNRLGTLYRDEKPHFIRTGKVKIHFACPTSNVNSEASVEPVLMKIFVKSGEDLRPLLPDYWRYYLTGTDRPSRLSAWQDAVRKATGMPLPPPGGGSAGTSAPKPIRTPEPKYTKEAAAQRIEGTTVLSTMVAASGVPEFIAVIQPLGMGLDEQAVAAVGGWKFRPAISNAQPVPVKMNLEITFKCCP